MNPSILADIRAGFLRKAYILPEQGLAVVFSDATGNRKIDAQRWIYRSGRGKRGFISASIAPLETESSPYLGKGARARAEIAACDRSCYWLSSEALAHHGRVMPSARQGKAAASSGAQCYVDFKNIRQAIRGARSEKALQLKSETMWRLTSWGDLSVLPASFLSELLQGIAERGGWSSRGKGDQVLAYTNAWRADSSASPEVRELLRGKAMASCSSLVEYAQALSAGWSPFFGDAGEDLEPVSIADLKAENRAQGVSPRAVPCKGDTKGEVSCSICRVCDGAQAPVLIEAH